jgi:outer membrane biosynthesis protein TonB
MANFLYGLLLLLHLMQKLHMKKIMTMLFVCFISTQLMAQTNKHKTVPPPPPVPPIAVEATPPPPPPPAEVVSFTPPKIVKNKPVPPPKPPKPPRPLKPSKKEI